MSTPSPVAAIALVSAGAALGFALFFVVFRASPEIITQIVTETETVTEQLSQEEIADICDTLTLGAKEQLELAQSNVTDLRANLEARELELAELRMTQERSAEAGVRVAERLRELEAEVQTLRTELVIVKEERDELIVELKDTVRKLEVQIRETAKYKQEAKKWKRKSTANAWRSFVAEAKVAMCDRGTKKRHDKCHEAVEAVLTSDTQDLFETCIDSQQATPLLRQSEKDEGLPAFAVPLLHNKAFATKGWHIRFCDPTLPEAGAPQGSPQ